MAYSEKHCKPPMLISSLPLVDILFTLSHPAPLGLLPQVFEQAVQVAKTLATFSTGNF